MHLDCDTTPPIKSRHVSKAYDLDFVVKIASDLIVEADAEGQIGIYNTRMGDGFKGYVIRYAGQAPYFEPALPEA